jgi:hypothetical protein
MKRGMGMVIGVHETLYEAVRERVYLEGYTPEQILARQVCKLQEELAELAEHMTMPQGTQGNVKGAILAAGLMARRAFDCDIWHYEAAPLDIARIRKELADMYVVLAVAEQVLNTISDDRASIRMLALEKAYGDIERGVRA